MASKKLSKITKVSESFTINRYDNGFMIEVQGRDTSGDWKTSKVLCSTETELFDIIKETIAMELDN